MQTWRLPLILISLVIIATAYLIFFDSKRAGTAEAIFLEKRLFAKFDPESAHRITIRRSKEEDLRFNLQESTWRIVEPFEFTADQFDIDDLLWLLADLEYIQKIPVPRDSSRLSAYGLSSPRYVLRANWGRRDEIELRIGDDSARPGSIYAQIRKNDAWVYTIPREVSDILARPATDWRNRRLLDTRGRRVMKIRRESSTKTSEINVNENLWTVASQDPATLDQDSVNHWVTSILSSRIARYCTPAEEDDVRRAAQEKIISLEFLDEQGQAIVGLRYISTLSSDGTPLHAARRIGETAWMYVDEELATHLNNDPADFLNTRPLRYPPSAVSRADITTRAESFQIHRVDGGWLIQPEGKFAETASVENFLAFMNRPLARKSSSPTAADTEHYDKLASFQFHIESPSDQKTLTEEFLIYRGPTGSLWGRLRNLYDLYSLDEETVRPLLVRAEDFVPKIWNLPESFTRTSLKRATILNSRLEELSLDRYQTFLPLLQRIDVSAWLPAESECGLDHRQLILESESNSRLIVCICDQLICQMRFEEETGSTAFVPLQAWAKLFFAALERILESEHESPSSENLEK